MALAPQSFLNQSATIPTSCAVSLESRLRAVGSGPTPSQSCTAAVSALRQRTQHSTTALMSEDHQERLMAAASRAGASLVPILVCLEPPPCRRRSPREGCGEGEAAHCLR